MTRFVDKAYLGFVKQLPCVVCFHYHGSIETPSDAHHTICGRYSQGKSGDHEAIPLCKAHHQYGDDLRFAIHEGKASWVEKYGPDTDYIAWTLDTVEKKFGYRPNLESHHE